MRFAASLAAFLLCTVSSQATPPGNPQLAIWRLDCGNIKDEHTSPWTDGYIPVSCYLVRHNSEYLLFDTGLTHQARQLANYRLRRTLANQLQQLKIAPSAIKYVAISHYHGDHTGQASEFEAATLLIGAEDLAAMIGPQPPVGVVPSHLRPWLAQGAPVRALKEDFDVFGDGSVVALITRGHTPGHLSLLVKLARRPVILSGDLWLSHDEAISGDMPSFNTSFGETEASRERVRRLALQHGALVVIGHDERDVPQLPAFPTAAE
jgi:glyoxylase-like metal-dependent hydrolase (beta-lactamase superfamily II)